MRFWTIWTIPACSIRERLRRTRDWAASEFASRLPLRVRYWCTLQEVGHATMTSPNIPGTPLEEVLRNMRRPESMS